MIDDFYLIINCFPISNRCLPQLRFGYLDLLGLVGLIDIYLTDNRFFLEFDRIAGTYEYEDGRAAYIKRSEAAAPSNDRKQQHLYLVFDDWEFGYSIRKVSLSRTRAAQASAPSSPCRPTQTETLMREALSPCQFSCACRRRVGFPSSSRQPLAPRSCRCLLGRLMMVVVPTSQLSMFRITPWSLVLDQTVRLFQSTSPSAMIGYLLWILAHLKSSRSRNIKNRGCRRDSLIHHSSEGDAYSYGVHPDGSLLVSTKRRL